MKGQSVHEPAECVCWNLRRAARAVTQMYDRALRPSGLRATQFTALAVVRALEPVGVAQLAEATGTDRTTLTRNLALLERHKLIRIEPGEDRRQRQITLSDRGRRVLEGARPLWEKAQERAVAGLGVGHWNALRGGLAAVAALARGK